MTLLDGKYLAAQIREMVRNEAADLPRRPGLAVVLVGEDPASRVYVNSKRRDCEVCGIYSEEYTLPSQISQEMLLELMETLNARTDIDGILLQLPLPSHLDEQVILSALSPDKDVDGFHPMSAGNLLLGRDGFIPCTPAGIMLLLNAYGIDPAGKRAVVIGRSNIVGKPMAMLMLRKDATVTICHSKTPDLPQVCRRADILVAAVGKTGLITPDMVKEGAVVVDVAMNRDSAGKLCGDCDRAVYEKSFSFTPVPGGVGPMTRAVLMENTFLAAVRHGA